MRNINNLENTYQGEHRENIRGFNRIRNASVLAILAPAAVAVYGAFTHNSTLLNIGGLVAGVVTSSTSVYLFALKRSIMGERERRGDQTVLQPVVTNVIGRAVTGDDLEAEVVQGVGIYSNTHRPNTRVLQPQIQPETLGNQL